MRTIEISDELFEELKGFVVDPFDDTPDAVIARLVEIVNKAKRRWSPLETNATAPQTPPTEASQGQPTQEATPSESAEQAEPIVVL